jgi:hypothetical protein
MQRTTHDSKLPEVKSSITPPALIGVQSPKKAEQDLSYKLKKLIDTEERVYNEQNEKYYDMKEPFNDRED